CRSRRRSRPAARSPCAPEPSLLQRLAIGGSNRRGYRGPMRRAVGVSLGLLATVSAALLIAGSAANGGVSGKPVVLAFGGDVHFEGPLEQRLAGDSRHSLAPITPVLSSADIAVVNLETAVTNGGTPASKDFTFRAPASAFAALRG